MQHFVVEDVTQKPRRNERLIQQRINPNDPIFFLDCAEDEIIFRALFASSSPLHLISAQSTAEITIIQLIKNALQIEMFTLMREIKLPLKRQSWMRYFAFRFLRHHPQPLPYAFERAFIVKSFDQLTR